MKRFYAITATLILGWGAAEAASLSGIVLDADGEPVAGAFVSADAGNRGMAVTVVSGRQGAYRIDELFPGDYSLSSEKFGYEASRADGFRLTANGGAA